MKYVVSAVLALMLTGCSLTMELSNRLTCTVAKDEAFVVSQYGPVGISSKIDQKDTQVVCK